MRKFSLLIVFCALFCMPGCASVPLQSPEMTAKAKEFAPPPPDKAGLYIYRDSFAGQALKKDIWVNGECVGESANNVFFYHQVPGDREHTIATESEFSPNELKIMAQKGLNYFIRQYIKIGVFVGGANLEVVDPETAKKAIAKLNMAVGGICSKPYTKNTKGSVEPNGSDYNF
ncbi:MAG: DUF2846 domain-containing protein [Deltaproteobacteria bacterium]|nr:DUF2846 domain-containing protein [Deltaproteobacteria bacterium]